MCEKRIPPLPIAAIVYYPRPMLTLPTAFEQALTHYLKQNYLKFKNASPGWEKRDAMYFAKGVMRLNELFTFERGDRPHNYFDDPVLRSGYLAYFLTVNAMKAFGVFVQHDPLKTIPRAITIADVGAGPLTLSFAFVFYLLSKANSLPEQLQLTIHALEQNRKILLDGRNLLFAFLEKAGFKNRIRVDVQTDPVNLLRQTPKKTPCDFVLVGNFFNEINKRDTQTRILNTLLPTLCRLGTHLLFLEPGTKRASRDLQAMRDRLIQESGLSVLGPCSHQNPCPLNQINKADWCHQRQTWSAPPFIEELDAISALKKRHLLYSYFLLTTGPSQNQQGNQKTRHASDHGLFMAVTDAMTDKHGYQVMGCGEQGFLRIIIAHSDRSANNDGITSLRRGLFFRLPNLNPKQVFGLADKVYLNKKESLEIL